jgi:hypothetical protein
MKVIGERISIVKKDNLLSIVILATNDKKKLALLLLWLLAWSVCGVIVLYNYFQVSNEKSKLFLIVYLSFWAYFEVSILRAYLWRKFGKEKIWFQDGILFYQREMRKKGKIREFQKDLIQDLKILDVKESNFMDSLNQSFWVKGGERLEFRYQSLVVRLGMQVSHEEARILLTELNKVLKV